MFTARRVRRGLIGLAGVVVAIQFIPVTRTNPPITRQVAWNSAATERLATRACADCHSHQTVWSVYSYIAPGSWLVAHNVNEAREKMNFSAWQVQDQAKLSRAVERDIKGGDMPPWEYRMLHPEARLTADEQAALIAGLQATIAGQP